MKTTIFISWEIHRRSRSLCKKLGIPLFELVSSKPRLVRYIALSFRTVRLLVARRPSCLIVQNPSIALSALAVIFKPLLGYKLLIDAHNEAVRPYNNDHKFFLYMARWIISRSDATIVSNDYLAQDVSGYGGCPIVVPDVLPDIPPKSSYDSSNEREILFAFICTYAKDEPFAKVFEAAEALKGKAKLLVTGKVPKYVKESTLSDNIALLGYIPDHDYISLLQKVDIVIDLTTMEHCLVCGSYEALQVEKPMILSKDEANERLFPCAILTKNDSQSICDAMTKAMREIEHLKTETKSWKEKFIYEEKERLGKLVDLLS